MRYEMENIKMTEDSNTLTDSLSVLTFLSSAPMFQSLYEVFGTSPTPYSFALL